MHDRTGSARFEIVASTDLPPGRYCTITETNGHVSVKLLKGDATSVVCDQLNEWHDRILGGAMWVKEDEAAWEAIFDARAATTPTDEERPTGRFQVVADGALPADCACYPIEAGGEFIWQIAERHMTKRLCAQLNLDLERVMREGHWVPRS